MTVAVGSSLRSGAVALSALSMTRRVAGVRLIDSQVSRTATDSHAQWDHVLLEAPFATVRARRDRIGQLPEKVAGASLYANRVTVTLSP